MNLISSHELIKSRKNLEIIQITAKQIQKDFQLFDETISFSGKEENAYKELSQQILPIIDRLLNLDSARFFSLLYTIDVKEKVIKDLLFSEDKDKNPSKEITELIIERELLKVLTRKYFSEQNKSHE